MTIRSLTHIVYKNVFDQDLIDLTHKLAPAIETATCTDDLNQRDSDISWIELSEKTGPLLKVISKVVQTANNKHWHFNIDLLEPLQFTQYDGKKEQNYRWHTDNHLDFTRETVRKVSFTILLNDDFKGGEFETENGAPDTPDRIQTAKLNKGDMIVFPSYVFHQVKPVTKGIRYSLVGWVHGPQWH